MPSDLSNEVWKTSLRTIFGDLLVHLSNLVLKLILPASLPGYSLGVMLVIKWYPQASNYLALHLTLSTSSLQSSIKYAPAIVYNV